MTIDFASERLITFAMAANLIPRCRQDRPVHPSTLWRWHRRGVKVGTGRVYLEAVKLPSGAATSTAAVARFIQRLNQDDDAQASPVVQDVQRLSQAVANLDQAGI